MSKSNVDIKKLSQQSYELYSLIHATNSILEDPDPISELRVNYEEKVSELAPQVLKYAKYAVVTRKNPRDMLTTAVVVAAAAAVGWAGAAGIDAARNGIAKAQAKKSLMGYYEQLASKQSMIIEEQRRITQEMADTIENLSDNEVVYREKIQTLQKRQAELADLLYRFNNLKNQVNK